MQSLMRYPCTRNQPRRAVRNDAEHIPEQQVVPIFKALL